jgi:hypothetical protein
MRGKGKPCMDVQCSTEPVICMHTVTYSIAANGGSRQEASHQTSDVRFLTSVVAFGNLRRYACKVQYLFVPPLYGTACKGLGGGWNRKRGRRGMDGRGNSRSPSLGHIPSPCPQLGHGGTHTVQNHHYVIFSLTHPLARSRVHGSQIECRRTRRQASSSPSWDSQDSGQDRRTTDARGCWGTGA